MPNRLAAETSPYLRQHADNPVDWYPWGEAALPRIALATPSHQSHAVRRQAQANAAVYDARGEWRQLLPGRWAEAFAVEPARSLMLQLGYDPAR